GPGQLPVPGLQYLDSHFRTEAVGIEVSEKSSEHPSGLCLERLDEAGRCVRLGECVGHGPPPTSTANKYRHERPDTVR
ncbi:MAG: hypothetical protein WBB44_12375, partial [Candidatus Nanopelagicales bacterium]